MPRLVRGLLIAYWGCSLLALALYCAFPDLPAHAPLVQGVLAAVLYVGILGGLIYTSAASRAERLWLLIAIAIGALAEWTGLHTGWPFGRYEYTALVVPQIDGWPPILGLAWADFAWYARYFVPTQWKPGRVLSAASWMVALDIVMDPVASGPLGLWRWLDGGGFYGVPELNFKGWLLVGALIMALEPSAAVPTEEAQRRRFDIARRVALNIGLSIIVFFTVLALRSALWVPAGIGAVLLGTHLWVVHKQQA